MSDFQKFEGDFGSLAHRAAQRRKEREGKRSTPIILPVPGYRDLYATKFRRVTPSEAEEIFDKHPDTTGRSVAMIVAGCEDLLAVTGHEDGKPVYMSLGRKWSPNTVAELFGVDVPAGATVRFALEQALDESEIRTHFEEYARAIGEQNKDDSGDLAGESKPSAEG